MSGKGGNENYVAKLKKLQEKRKQKPKPMLQKAADNKSVKNLKLLSQKKKLLGMTANKRKNEILKIRKEAFEKMNRTQKIDTIKSMKAKLKLKQKIKSNDKISKGEKIKRINKVSNMNLKRNTKKPTAEDQKKKVNKLLNALHVNYGAVPTKKIKEMN